MVRSTTSLSTKIAEALSLAIVLEASGYPKPGNVHRLRDRKALRYEAFLATGVLAYKYMKRGFNRGLKGSFGKLVFGDLVYGVVRDVIHNLKSSNTCLGSSLLLSLMAVSTGFCSNVNFKDLDQLSNCSKEVMSRTTVLDTIYYYMAIRKAAPSFLKPTDRTGDYVNVWDPHYRKKLQAKSHRLVDVLQYSSKFDIVAREAITGFKQGIVVEEFLRSRFGVHRNFNRAVVETYLYLLSQNVDTVVYLKHGPSVAREVMNMARSVLEALMSIKSNSEWFRVVLEFDNELQRREINPGAVADLTAETLALYMIKNIIEGGPILDLST